MLRIVPRALAIVLVLATAASAEPLAVKAVMSPKEQIYADLPTSQKHFVFFVRREGTASGTGILDGAQLTEYGMHDIRPGLDGSPRGYLVAKLPSGDQAVIQWEVQATFVPGPDGRSSLTTASGASSVAPAASAMSTGRARCTSGPSRPRIASSN